jgi:hypothetical protein
MKLRQSIFSALLLAIGYVLHLVAAPFLGGMKPDLLLSMLFIALLLVDDVQVNLQTGLLAGLIAAMTTTFPGGQIPNIIDKLIVTLLLMAVLKLIRGRLPQPILAGTLALLGTLVSGSVFLLSALFIVGLPAPFEALFVAVVLPATLANTVITAGMVVALIPAMSAARISFLNSGSKKINLSGGYDNAKS